MFSIAEQFQRDQEDSAFFREQAWAAYEAGDSESAGHYMDIHAEAEQRFAETKAHITRRRYFDERLYKRPEYFLQRGAAGLVVASCILLGLPEERLRGHRVLLRVPMDERELHPESDYLSD